MKSTYLIKIFTRSLQTKFELTTDSSMITMGQVEKEVVDFLGKNRIKWEPNPLQFHGTARGGDYYMTYEEVKNG